MQDPNDIQRLAARMLNSSNGNPIIRLPALNLFPPELIGALVRELATGMQRQRADEQKENVDTSNIQPRPSSRR